MADLSPTDLERLADSLSARMQLHIDGQVQSVMNKKIDSAFQDKRLSPFETSIFNDLIEARLAKEKSLGASLAKWAPIAISVVAILLALSQVYLAQRNLQNNLIYTMQKDQRLAILEYASGRTGPEYLFAQMQSIYLQYQQDSIPNGVWNFFLQDFCSVMKHANFRRSWEDTYKERGAAFSQDFVDFMTRIQDLNSEECKGRTAR